MAGRRQYQCPVEVALDVIGGKWKPLILHQLIHSTLRYNELHRLMPGVSHKVLSQQLRELEDDGIIERQVYPEVPPKVEYRLTELGKTIIPMKEALSSWGMMYLERKCITLVPRSESPKGEDTKLKVHADS